MGKSRRTKVLITLRPSQQARSRATLERIVVATRNLLQCRRFDQIGIHEIVSEARSSVGAFYTRFSDKDGLLAYLHELYCEESGQLADSFLEPVQWKNTPLEQVIETGVGVFVELVQSRRSELLEFWSRENYDDRFRQVGLRVMRRFADALARLIKARQADIPDVDSEDAADFIVSILLGTLHHEMVTHNPTPDRVAWLRARLGEVVLRHLGLERSTAALDCKGTSVPPVEPESSVAS